MSLYTDALSYGVDSTAVQAGDFSFGTKAGAVVAGAVTSGLSSIYNTAAAGINALGGSLEEIKTQNVLSQMDSDMGRYYQENAHAIDTVGFIATSLLPGTLAIKGLNAVRAGNTGSAIGRALNFTKTKQAQAIEAGLTELATEGGTVFTRINASKMASMGWEAADQVLQAAVFETAVALTMKQSPMLADDDWWSIGKNIVVGAALGGGIGGTIGAFQLNKSFKEAVKQVDLAVNKGTALSGLNRLDLTGGDKAMGLVEAIAKLPDEMYTAGVPVRFNIAANGMSTVVTKDIAPLLDVTRKASIKAAKEELELSFRKLASGGDAGAGGTAPETAEAFANFLTSRYTSLKQSGLSNADIKDRMGDTLFGLKDVSAATDLPLYGASDLFYFSKKLSPEKLSTVKSINDLEGLQRSRVPGTKDAYEKPYIFLGSPEQYKNQVLAVVGREGENSFKTLAEAWNAGHSMAMLPDGAVRVNPATGLWRQVDDPVNSSKQFLNTNTGAVTHDTVLTAADRAASGKRLQVNPLGVSLENSKGELKVVNMRDGFKPTGTVEYVTARHAWASQLPPSSIPGVIDATDISLLTRVAELDPATRANILIKHLDGSTSSAEAVDSHLLRIKVEGVRDAFLAGQQDTRALAYQFNTTPQWISDLVGHEFGAALRDPAVLKEGMSRNLSDFMQRENLTLTYERPQQFTALGISPETTTWRDRRDYMIAQASASGGQFVTGELAWAYRVQGAIKASQNAAAAVLGATVHATLPKLAQDVAKLADSVGSGASFLGSANAGYGETFRLAAQDIGKTTHKLLLESDELVSSSLATVNSRILQSPKAAAELGIVTNLLRNDPSKFIVYSTAERTLLVRELSKITDSQQFAAAKLSMEQTGLRTEIKVADQDAWDYLITHSQMDGTRVSKETTLINARGHQTNKDPSVVYAPPVDTNYFQHFAFVRGIDGKAFGTSETAMIFGRTAAELQQRMAQVDRSLFEVITKDAGERYHKAKGSYDFDQTINERTIDSELRRTGALSNFFPETRAQNIVEDYLRYHQGQERKLIRNAVETNYSQQIQELEALGRSYTEDATSKFSGTLRSAKSEVTNPYDDFKKTMLDVSKRSEYTFFHQANEFVDALGTRAYQVLSSVTQKANKGLIPWSEANAIAEQHGIRGMYSSSADYFLSNAPRDRNIAKEFVTRANAILGNLVLRFDFAQGLMNTISTPLLLSTELSSIRGLVGKDSAEAGLLRELTQVKVPGQDAAVPSTLKLLHNAIGNFWGPEKANLLKRYTDNGDIKNSLNLYHEAIDSLSMSPDFKVFSAGVTKTSDFIGKWTGNDFAEQFTRFVSADVMRQLTEPLVKVGRMDLQTANSYISTFVNRVQGNYITSQRPVVFQGVLGGAIGLFQTYSFNLLQQLFRHVGSQDSKTAGVMFGMQAGLFGLNGIPMFDAINTHIVGNSSLNPTHKDAYSLAPQLLGKELGDWLMYGSVSAMPGFGDKWPALYSRGDINPRHITVLPINPVDIPAIDSSIRVVNNLQTMGKKLLGGADISETLLQGLEHNGLNRPLAGLAQVIAGKSTTSKGSLISANSDMDLITHASRILGSRPMDEAVALNALFRGNAYRAADKERAEALGEVVKTKLVRNQFPADAEFMEFMRDYTKIGGRLENFNASVQHWSRDANTSVVERIRTNLQSEQGKRLSEIMGGVGLEDFRNQAPAAQ
jgi:hypothetical protein